MEVNDKNIEVFANLAINSTQCASQRIQIPRLTYLAQIFSMLSECELSLKITILDESTTVPLVNNAWLDVPINIVGNFAQFDLIVNKFNTQSKLHLLIASFMDRSNLPVDLKDILIVHRPEQNVTIMFDFTDAIAIAAGCEKCLNKEVQITNSS